MKKILFFFWIFIEFPKEVFEAALVLPHIMTGEGYLEWKRGVLRLARAGADPVWTLISVPVVFEYGVHHLESSLAYLS